MPSPGQRFEPQNAFCFALHLDNHGSGAIGFFKSISGLKSETEIVPFKEGGLNTTTHKLMGPVQWPNLILKRGFTGPDSPLLLWRERYLKQCQGGGKIDRISGRVVQLSSDLKQVCSWKFRGGWPAKWDGPEYDASKSELAIETLEIAHDGLTFEASGGGR